MISETRPSEGKPVASHEGALLRRCMPAIVAGLLSWGAIALGFFGLHMLMHERPEFVGQPMSTSKVEMVQESPRIVMRKATDDTSTIKPMQPASTEIALNMHGRRDYRGLKTIVDMSGTVVAHHSLTNSLNEAIFVLLKCPHPRAESDSTSGLLAGGLKLQASVPGIQENSKESWLWSGTIEGHGSVGIQTSYQVMSLKGFTYKIGSQEGEPVKQARLTFHRRDLDSIQFESGDGRIQPTNDTVVWERSDFLGSDSFSARLVESRNLYTSLLQLLEIGPVVSFLFLLAVSAVILTRQPLSMVQVFTLSAGYALYFPLMLYLTSRFSFPIALALAFLVPGVLLINYTRLLLGNAVGLIGGICFLILYQVFPTLAAFAGWNRGMVLLCLGVVTLGVLFDLQNQALRRKTASAVVFLILSVVDRGIAGDVQVIVPGQIVVGAFQTNRTTAVPLLSFETANYMIRQEVAYFQVEASVLFQIARTGEVPVPLFAHPVFLREKLLKTAEIDVARFAVVSNRWMLVAQQVGSGSLRFVYRVPVESFEGSKRVRVPLLLGASGEVRIETDRVDLENRTGSLWSKTSREKLTVYDLGTAGDDLLILQFHDNSAGVAANSAKAEGERNALYGIGITSAQHLTVMGSEGSCTHFTELVLPSFQTGEFRMRLPKRAQLISVSAYGIEMQLPPLEDQVCRVRLPDRDARATGQRLSFRLAYPPVRLGFVGSVELGLPEVFQTIGTLSWVVALPTGFESQVISSGLEIQKGPPDLAGFGDYGRILKGNPTTWLTKDLAVPSPVSLNLRYRQSVAGW